MSDRFRLTLAQLNPTVGDLAGNRAKAAQAWQAAKAAGADMVALPEMFITGYQAQDLVLKPAFTADAMAHVTQLARDCADGPAIGIGGPLVDGTGLYNAYFVLKDGEIRAAQFTARAEGLPTEVLVRPGTDTAPVATVRSRLLEAIASFHFEPREQFLDASLQPQLGGKGLKTGHQPRRRAHMQAVTGVDHHLAA